MGIPAALNRGGLFDRSSTFFSYFFISFPGFFLAYLLILGVAKFLEVPVLGMRTFGQETAPVLFWLNDRIWHMVLPSLLGAIGGIAFLSRYVRAQMIEVIDSDFVRTG